MSDERDADGFTLVGRKRRGKKPTFAQNERLVGGEDRRGNFKNTSSLEGCRKVDKAAVKNKVLLARDEFQSSEFYSCFQVSLLESLKEQSSAGIDQDNVNISEERQAGSSSTETQSNVCEAHACSLKNSNFGSSTVSCSEYDKDEQFCIKTDHEAGLKCEDGVLGHLRDEVTKVKGQTNYEVTSKLVQTVVCYGLGNFSDCVIARYQLALLLLICDSLKVKTCNCHVYDPRFTTEEVQIATHLGLNVIPQNEECKRAVTQATLFYMPHCGKPLYNNLLWANWSMMGLANIIVIGNSFNSVQERLPSRVLQEFTYLHQIIPHTREVPVRNTFHFSDIFNDTSIHLFPSERLRTLPSTFWDRNNEPLYKSDAAIEIILSK